MSTVILAGGRGSRLNNVDKGLVELDGKALIQHIVDLLTGFNSQLIISCNRNTTQYAALGAQLVSDKTSTFDGPLAGLLSAAPVCNNEYILTLPCDMPFLDPSCFTELLNSLHEREFDIAVAHDGERRQNLVMMLRKHCLASIEEYLRSGKRRVDAWQNQWRVTEVDFSDRSELFRNLNTQADFDRHKKTPINQG